MTDVYKVELFIFFLSLIIILCVNIGKRTFEKMMIDYVMSFISILISIYIIINSTREDDVGFLIISAMLFLRILLHTKLN